MQINSKSTLLDRYNKIVQTLKWSDISIRSEVMIDCTPMRTLPYPSIQSFRYSSYEEGKFHYSKYLDLAMFITHRQSVAYGR